MRLVRHRRGLLLENLSKIQQLAEEAKAERTRQAEARRKSVRQFGSTAAADYKFDFTFQ
jgi:hypothetical protein